MPNRVSAFAENSNSITPNSELVYERLEFLWAAFAEQARMGDPESGRLALAVLDRLSAILSVRDPNKIESGTLDYLRDRRRSRLSVHPASSDGHSSDES